MVQPDRPRHNITRRMRFAGWLIMITAHARNIQYTVTTTAFRGDNAYRNVSQCYVYTYHFARLG